MCQNWQQIIREKVLKVTLYFEFVHVQRIRELFMDDGPNKKLDPFDASAISLYPSNDIYACGFQWPIRNHCN